MLTGCGTLCSPFQTSPCYTWAPAALPANPVVSSPGGAGTAPATPATAVNPYDAAAQLSEQVDNLSQRLDQVEQHLRPAPAPVKGQRGTP